MGTKEGAWIAYSSIDIDGREHFIVHAVFSAELGASRYALAKTNESEAIVKVEFGQPIADAIANARRAELNPDAPSARDYVASVAVRDGAAPKAAKSSDKPVAAK